MRRRLFPALFTRPEVAPATPDQLVRQLMDAAEAQVRTDMHKKAVHVDFWGGLHVDPNWVYVSKETAQRSTEALKAFMARRQALGETTSHN